MIVKNTGYSYNDLTIVPAPRTFLKSRSEANPYNDNGTLPIFTAPMSTVVCEENIEFFVENKINVIIPRNIDFERRLKFLKNGWWTALSLKEAKEIFFTSSYNFKTIRFNDEHDTYICIDVANGHMDDLIETCRYIKVVYGDSVTVMAGNIANPRTIKMYADAKIDMVRCSIGSGNACTTAPQTGIHYPIASLIDECYRIKKETKSDIKIIADGGIRNYGDVIKALALGADYVMIGSLFAGCLESAAEFNDNQRKHEIFIEDNIGYGWFHEYRSVYDRNLSEKLKRTSIIYHPRKKVFYGMSTKKAQQMIKSDAEIKTSEGTEKVIPVRYTLNQWIENMTDYLRSAMSYCNCRTLDDFIGKQTLIVNSLGEINAVNK